ncbi:ankyrin [Myriangium duriaei CBS 260.36]|uniref:Ankyrin n=1 Tax=Myriangium duriaei CBS 260.36 TaxID=1168546 RepID=A0A9P4IVC6_9PEZI|nr:ankyrin [Myriangium duriaei CBS 260.36]
MVRSRFTLVTGSYHVSAQKSSRDQHGSNDPRQSKQALARNKRYSRNIMRHKNASRKEVFDMPEHISTYLADRTKKRLGSARHPDTTNWIFDNENFRQWLENESGSCFALTGIIGSGKTTCTTNVIDFLQHWSKSHRRQVFHFFYETLIPQRLLGVHALEAFLKQMILLNPELPKDLQQRLEDYYGPEPSRPPIEQLGTDLILPLIRCLRNPIFVIDGLDECEQNSRQDLIEILSPIVAEGSLLFISTRDASDLSSRFPHLLTAQCSTRESGVRHDLDIFISSLIHQQNTRRILTKDQEVLKTIKTTLLEKAGSMFLWVKLLVLDLWSECSDTGIEDYLANRLPADLEETYARCMRRVHPSRVELSTDMFRLVCSAVEPFNINELCAMLTLSMKAAQQNGCLVFKRAEPLPEVLIRDCGVHLVAVDECGLVLPVHHSVQQHVFPKKFVPYGEDSALQWQRIVAELNIGMICMLLIQQHLDQALVRRRSKYNNLSVMHFQPLTVFNHISSIFGDRDQPKQIPGPSLFTSSAAESMRSQVLLAYAQRSWIQSNRQIGRIVHFSLTKALPSSWPLFMKLTSEQHENVSFPWPRFETNHLHGLFVWAVTHNHVPLIDVLKQPCCSETVKKLDLFNKPLLPPNQGFALHHAAQSGDERFFRVLWTVVDIWKADLDGNTALHIGARTGNGFATRSYRLIESFPNKIGSVSLRKSKTQIFERSSATPLTNSALQNPLHMAVMGGRVDCVRDAIGLAIALMGVMLTEVTETTRPAFLHGEHLWIYHTDVDGNMPLDYAIMTGSVKFLESCLACFAEAKLNHVRYDGLLLTKAIKLQKWDHAIFLVENKSIDISYPFDTSHPLPDPDLPVARSLFEAIVVARPVWIPMLLEDAWRVGTIAKEGWHDWLMSLHLLPRRDDLDLKLFTLCQIIHRTRADEPFYYNRRVIPPHWLPGLDMEWSKLAQIPDRNWESVVVAEAVATKNHHILHIILDLRCQLQPYVLYSAARSGDIYAIDLLLELRDAAWAAAIHRESAARIAERHGNVHAFLKLRGDDQFPTISREWLLSIDDFIFFCLQKEQDILLPLIASVEGDRIADRMLWYASALGVTDLAIKMLDERAAYINYQGKDSTTALWQAAYSASWNLVIALLLRGADATIAAGGSGLSPKEPFEGSRPNITDRDMEEARTPRELALFLHGPGERDTVHWRAIMKLEDREAGSCRPPTIVLTPAF